MHTSLSLLLLATACRFIPESGTLKLGNPQALIRQEDGQATAQVIVTLPVLPTGGEQATFTVRRDGQNIDHEASPSATLAGGTDLIDRSATFRTKLSYEITATFPGKGTAKQAPGISLARTLIGFPRIAEPAQGANLQGTRPKFRWDAVGLDTAQMKLDVTPQSGQPQSWLIGKGTAAFDWGTPATASGTGFAGYPQKLVPGIEVTAQVTAMAGPAERSDLSGVRTLVTEQVRSKPISFTP
jgi:hypothetical protein